MQLLEIQPNATSVPAEIVQRVVRAAVGAEGESVSFAAREHGGHSNDLVEVSLRDGRTLMIKRGRYPWSRARFEAARRASGLLRARAGLLAPAALRLPAEGADIMAYWRIGLPTLAECWAGLNLPLRRQAMRSFGRAVRQVHGIRFPGHGPLSVASARPIPLSQALAEDLGGRLMPAASAEWPDGVDLVDFLLGYIPRVTVRAENGGVLLHGDLHMGNVLYARCPASAGCAGFLDLDEAHAGPPESDLARLAVIHTALFNQPLEEPWFEWVKEGYGLPVDPVLFGYYQMYHLCNLGFGSALVGHAWHARQVAESARTRIADLTRRVA